MFEQKCEERDMIRTLRADVISFAGMGAKKVYAPKEIDPIPFIDNADLVMPIKSIDEAMKLVKMFEAHSG